MRVGVVGVAAAAMVGGTLAVAPLTMSGPMRTPNQGTCTAGQQCDRLASVLMPGTSAQPGKPAQAAPAPAQLPTDALTPVLAPRAAPEAARAVPGWPRRWAGTAWCHRLGSGRAAGRPPLPNAALPPGPGLPDIGTPYIGTPNLGIPGLGLPGVPNLANGPAAVGTATSVVNGILGIGGTIAGVTTSSALAVTYVVLAYNALQSSGILPQLNSTANTIGSMLFPSGLPSVGLPTLSLPGLPALSGCRRRA
ncbi:putative membrane protein [Mycobacterium kansasii 732]|nr:putative membrane protein [Mycobacterium kansasii 732]